MATTRIMPLHIGKGRTESRAISDIIDYVANPQKTDNGKLITSYGCDSRTADAEFLLAKRQYIAATGRVRGTDDVIAYHVRQSFRPGEITPEEANRLGIELPGGSPKAIIPLWSAPTSTNRIFIITSSGRRSIWIVTGSSVTFGEATRAVRRLSDTICIETDYPLWRTPSPTEKATTSGWANKPSPPIGNSYG